MSSTRNPGRVAGFWYLLLVVIGPLRLIYIPNKLFVHGNATATASNIAAHERLFRLGMVSELVGAIVLILLVLAFYRLFERVDQYLAVLVVIFGGVMPATISIVSVVSDAGALMVVRGADFLSVFDKPQRDALAMLFLQLGNHQTTAAEILWGVWLLPLAVLVYRSRFLPRFLGVWLVINGFAYVIMSFTGSCSRNITTRSFLSSNPLSSGSWRSCCGSSSRAPSRNRSTPQLYRRRLVRLHRWCLRTQALGAASTHNAASGHSWLFGNPEVMTRRLPTSEKPVIRAQSTRKLFVLNSPS